MKTILIIENDPDTMEIFESIVSGLGLNPVCVGEPIDADMIDKINPALILLDHRLDYSFGGDLCRELKANPLTTRIPVVIISADLGVAAVANKSGADGFVAKPFQLQELEQLILGYV